MTNFLIDLLGFLAVLSSILVITSQNPVISVLFLISVFINAAGYLILIGLGFIAVSYLIVYIGAIAILFLFVIMILNIKIVEIVSVGKEYSKNLPLGLIVSTLFLWEIINIFNSIDILPNSLLELNNNIMNFINISNNIIYISYIPSLSDTSFNDYEQIMSIGINLYSYGAISLIIVSLILLLGIIGPIALTLKNK